MGHFNILSEISHLRCQSLSIIIAKLLSCACWVLAGEEIGKAYDEDYAMPTAAITKRNVDAFEAAERDAFLWDATLPGFGLKATPSGGKTYLFQYRIGGRGGVTRRYTIGRHGPLTPDEARKRAKALAALVEQGIDPRQQELDAKAEKEAAKREAEEQSRLDGELAFENVAKAWLAEYELDHRPATVGQARNSLNKYLLPKLRGKAMPRITKTDLQAAINAIPAKRKASRQQVFAYASILFGWALENDYIANNPIPSMAKPKGPKARNRVLTDDELISVWAAAAKLPGPLAAFYRLLILTGQRREEVAGMSWAELDRATAMWIIPGERAKNGVAHIVPLAPAVLEELDRLTLAKQQADQTDELDPALWPKIGPVVTLRGTVSITCYSQAKRKLDAEVEKVRKDADPLEPWRVHDIRRTVATGLQRLGIRFEVTEAVLNHVSGAKGGVAGIYQRHDWKDEKRAALSAWALHVERLISGAESNNVVALGVRA